MVWKQIDANTFERRTALNGKPLSVRRIRISDDGKTLTEESERFSLDGQTLKRTAQYQEGVGGRERPHRNMACTEGSGSASLLKYVTRQMVLVH